MPIKSGTTAYTLTDADYTYLTNNSFADNVADVTLPSAIGREGRIYIIKNIGGKKQWVLPSSGETIDGNTEAKLDRKYDKIGVQSDGSNWWIIIKN